MDTTCDTNDIIGANYIFLTYVQKRKDATVADKVCYVEIVSCKSFMMIVIHA